MSCRSVGAGYVSPPCQQSGNLVYEQYGYDNALTTGNLTGLQQWDSGNGVPITNSWTYQPNGNIASYTDPNTNLTAITYDSNNLYPTQVALAANTQVQRRMGYSYDSNSGLLQNETDSDNSISTTYSYDNLGRQLAATQTGGTLSRTTSTTYDDVNLGVTATDPDNVVTTTYYDALGRVRYSLNPNAGINVQSAYRYGSGSVSYELDSNPYTSGGDQTMGWTLTTRDAVGRTTEVDTYQGSAMPAPWGAPESATGTTKIAYAGNSGTPCVGFNVQVTDQAADQHINCLDGLGRLAAVQEPGGNITSYGYDILDDLSCVTAPGSSFVPCSSSPLRTFNYSSLSRLLSATNPEAQASLNCNGLTVTTCYTYDFNGNLRSRTDANGVVTSIGQYDGLNRPPGISYSNDPSQTPAVTYTYDIGFRGALSSVGNSNSTTSYTHDSLGRIATSVQQTNGTNYNFSYNYSAGDQLTSITYPSGRQITYSLDTADRVTSVTGILSGTQTNYAQNITYTAASGISALPTGNGLTSTLSWNDRLQPTGLSVTNSSSSQVLGLNFYPCPSSATACATDSTNHTGNNGNLLSQTISAPNLGSLTQTYGYDALNRLTSITEGSSTLEQYGYDGFGNRWVTNHASSLPILSLETPTAQSNYSTTVPNRISETDATTPWNYDKAGNVLQVFMGTGGSRSFTYDGENREVSAVNASGTTSAYTYDGLGQRVSKTVGGVTTYYAYDAFGNLAAEYGPSEPSPCGTGTCYLSWDHLGSTRLLTDSSGNPQRRYDYLPFGSEIPAGVDGRPSGTGGYLSNPDDINPKFTGQQRDPELGGASSSMDWFIARYYSGGQGRFQSVDPANAGADPSDPQTWNGYSYVANNPLSYIDPSGMVEEAGGGGGGAFGAVAGLIVQGFEAFGHWIAGEFSGSKPKPQPIPFTGPTWHINVDARADAGSINLFSGLPADLKGNQCTASPLSIPLVINSPFGDTKPPYSERAPHTGVDYRAPGGTQVNSAEAGKVGWAAPLGTAGNAVIVQSPAAGVNTFYYHLSQIFVRLGQQVPAGAPIALSGNTGLVVGANGGYHLHFEQHPYGPMFGQNGLPAGPALEPCH